MFTKATSTQRSIPLSSGYGTTSRPHRRSTTLDQQLEPVLQRDHVWICILVQLKRIGYDLDTPGTLGLFEAHLEANPKVAGVLGHAAESVHGAVGVSFAIVFEPEFCSRVSGTGR